MKKPELSVTCGAGQGTGVKLCNACLLLKLYIGNKWSDESRPEDSRQKSLGLGWHVPFPGQNRS